MQIILHLSSFINLLQMLVSISSQHPYLSNAASPTKVLQSITFSFASFNGKMSIVQTTVTKSLTNFYFVGLGMPIYGVISNPEILKINSFSPKATLSTHTIKVTYFQRPINPFKNRCFRTHNKMLFQFLKHPA